MKDYYMSVLYNHDKANVVADSLSHMSIGSASHVDEAKKYLEIDIHRLSKLGVTLKHAPNGGFIFNHNSKSSLVAEVKSKQHLD